MLFSNRISTPNTLLRFDIKKSKAVERNVTSYCQYSILLWHFSSIKPQTILLGARGFVSPKSFCGINYPILYSFVPSLFRWSGYRRYYKVLTSKEMSSYCIVDVLKWPFREVSYMSWEQWSAGLLSHVGNRMSKLRKGISRDGAL